MPNKRQYEFIIILMYVLNFGIVFSLGAAIWIITYHPEYLRVLE
ncbi:hypothetical protein [Paenibacillus sp. FSL R5-0490]|nr:hypothetical protein [Paenibacillus sp. FSL R5-0490]